MKYLDNAIVCQVHLIILQLTYAKCVPILAMNAHKQHYHVIIVSLLLFMNHLQIYVSAQAHSLKNPCWSNALLVWTLA